MVALLPRAWGGNCHWMLFDVYEQLYSTLHALKVIFQKEDNIVLMLKNVLYDFVELQAFRQLPRKLHVTLHFEQRNEALGQVVQRDPSKPHTLLCLIANHSESAPQNQHPNHG